MAPVIHSSTPARVSLGSGATSVTTAAFNPPADCLILAFYSQDLGPDVTATVTMSNNGAATTWQSIGQIGDTETNQATAAHQANAFFTTLASARTGMTVTVTTNTGNEISLKCYVLTGHDAADPIGTNIEGFDVASSFTTDNLVPESLDSLIFCNFADDNASANPTIDGTGDVFRVAGTIAGGSSYKASTNPTTFSGSGTGARMFIWQVVEIKPSNIFRSGSVSAPLSLAASTTGQKRSTQTVTAPLTLTATRTGQKRIAASRTAPLTLAASLAQAGKRLSGTAVATTLTLGVQTGGARVRYALATPLSLNVTRQGNKIGQGAPSAALSLAATRAGKKIGVGSPAPVLTLAAAITFYQRTGGDPIPVTRIPIPPITNPMRLIAQNVLTRQWLDWDLPLTDVEYERQLSGPTIIRGKFKPEIESVRELNLDAWSTWVHVEIEKEIRASGIMLPANYNDSEMTVECLGISGIPSNYTYQGEYSQIQVDPLVVYRHIWAHILAQPESNYNVFIGNATSPRKLGEPARREPVLDENGQQRIDENGQPEWRDIEAQPYQLMWWDAVDLGRELDNLASQTPFDYVEKSSWNTTKTDVVHLIDLGYPRSGRKREDLRFAEGENILDVVPVKEGTTTYASAVWVVGAGEGRDAIRGYAGERYLNRVRRVITIVDKSITTTQRANDRARVELLARRGAMLEIAEITVDAMHENAPLGTYDLGDDILPQVYVPWLGGEFAQWHRILSIIYKPDRDLITLRLARSDSFRYGSVT